MTIDYSKISNYYIYVGIYYNSTCNFVKFKKIYENQTTVVLWISNDHT